MSSVKLSMNDLEPGKMKGISAGGQRILAVNLDGKCYAIGNRCTHAGCMLSGGELKGEAVQCPCHSSQFDVKTGNVVRGPAQKPEPVFRVKVEGDQVSISV